MEPRFGTPPTARQRPSIQEVLLLVGLACCGFILTGIGTSSFGLFINPVRGELNWTAEQASRLPGIFFLATAIASPACGWLVDKVGARVILPAGILLQMAGFFLASQAATMPAMLFSFALAGIGGSGAKLSFTYYITSESKVGVGLAMGIFVCGSSAGTALIPIGVERTVAEFGWRTALAMNVGLVACVVLPIALLIARRKIDTASQAKTEKTGASGPIPFAPFTLLVLAEFLFMACVMGLFIHIVPMFVSHGFTSAYAIMLLSFCGILGSIVPIATGWLADRLGAGPVLLFNIALHTAAMTILIFLSAQTSFVSIATFAVLWGITSGSASQLAVPLITRIIPPNAVGRALGIQNFVLAGASASGPVMLGAFADTSGGYASAMVLATGLSLASAVPITLLYLFFLRKRPMGDRRHADATAG